MGFWKKLGKSWKGSPSAEELEAIRENDRQLQMEREERKRRKEILVKFSFKELKLICSEILGREPDDLVRDENGNIERYEDGTPHKYHVDRYLYEDFICDTSNFKMSQSKILQLNTPLFLLIIFQM